MYLLRLNVREGLEIEALLPPHITLYETLMGPCGPTLKRSNNTTNSKITTWLYILTLASKPERGNQWETENVVDNTSHQTLLTSKRCIYQDVELKTACCSAGLIFKSKWSMSSVDQSHWVTDTSGRPSCISFLALHMLKNWLVTDLPSVCKCSTDVSRFL